MKEIVNFQLEAFNLSKINPLVSRYKVFIAYPDEPANGYIFSKEVLLSLSNTILGCPVVAGFMNNKDGSLLGGHELDLALDKNNKVKRTPTTIPVGFASYDQPCWFEEYKGKNFLTTFIYIWDGRFPELENLSERTIFQSLEVAVDEEPDGKYKIVKEAYALGLCLLENVNPAFEFSTITKFSLDNIGSKIDLLTSELNLLKQEYENFSNNNQIQKQSDLQVESELESKNNLDNDKLDTLNIDSTKEFSNNTNQEKEVNEEVIKEAMEKFSLNSSQIIEILNNAMSEYKYGANSWRKYWVYSFDEIYAFIEDCEDSKIYRFLYTIENNIATIDLNSKEEVIRGGYELVGQKIEQMSEEAETKELSTEEMSKSEVECAEQTEEVTESSNEFIDNPAMQELNDKSAEDNKELAGENLENPEEVNASEDVSMSETEEEDKDTIIMSLKQEMSDLQEKFSKMETDMNVYMAENTQLKEFKASIDKQNKEFSVETTLKEVQNILPTEEIETCRLSAEKFSLEDIDVWKNEVKAKAFNFSKGIPEKKPFIQVAFPNSDKPKGGKGLWD